MAKSNPNALPAVFSLVKQIMKGQGSYYSTTR